MHVQRQHRLNLNAFDMKFKLFCSGSILDQQLKTVFREFFFFKFISLRKRLIKPQEQATVPK